jgi:hypothetical protein
MNDKRLLLGRVEKIDRVSGTRIGVLRPTHREFETKHGLRWESGAHPMQPGARKPDHEAALALWLNAPADLAIGSIWQFYTEQGSSRFPDRLRVVDPTAPVELIDHKAYSIDASRRALSVGLAFDAPPSENVLLWVSSNRWVGPIRLVPGGIPGAWVAHSTSLLQPLGVYNAVPEAVDQVEIDGRRLILAPGRRLTQPVGEIDWASDAVVLRRFLRWVSSEYASDLELVNAVQQFVERTIERDEPEGNGSDSMVLKERLERIRTIIKAFRFSSNEIDEVVEDLLGHPRVVSVVTKAEEEARRRTVEETQATLALEMATAAADVESLKAQAASLRQELSEMQDELELARLYAEEQRAEAERQSGEFESAIAARVQRALAQPMETLAEVSLLRALVRGTGAGGADGFSKQVSSVSRPPRSWDSQHEPGPPPEAYEDFKATVRRHFQARGLSSGAGQVLAAALLSDVVPVLGGSEAYRALGAFASAAFGGRCLWIPASPVLLEPSDILGRWDSLGKEFVPHAAGLLELLEWSAETGKPYLVVIDGLNLAPVDSYLMPLLHCYLDAQNGTTGRRLPFDHCAADGSFRRSVSWPAHVHIAGVLSDAACSVRMSPSIWECAAYLHLDDLPRETIVGGDQNGDPACASVSPEQWLSWKRDAISSVTPNLQEMFAEAQNASLRIPYGMVRSGARTFGAHRLWSSNPKGAWRTVVENRLLPYCVASGQANEFSKQFGKTGDEAKALEDQIRRATRLLG